MNLHDWQKIEAGKLKPSWLGDLNDDCTAIWAGLTLRAEIMENDDIGAIWWWAVSDNDSGKEIDSSNNHPNTIIRTGNNARYRSEMVAYRWLGVERKTNSG